MVQWPFRPNVANPWPSFIPGLSVAALFCGRAHTGIGVTMKLFTTSAIALAAAFTATPAAAQYGSMAPPSQPTPMPRGESETTDKVPDKATKGITPSKQAYKALVDLQKAVNAKDTANIPAKLAA